MKVHSFDLDQHEAADLAAGVRALQPQLSDLADPVARIIDRVRRGGDAELLAIAAEIDGKESRGLAVDPARVDQALDRLDQATIDALELAAANIKAVAEAQIDEVPVSLELPQGQIVTLQDRAMGQAGIYVPGGPAGYPSSALMGTVPARVAGVERIVVVTPPGDGGQVPDATLAACAIGGAEEVYAIGGAQAIAALAYGTETIRRVDLIAGPGNRYVQEAKRQVVGDVGIDALAGPSELMVVFDESAELRWLALDLCAQAEHGPGGLMVAVATDSGLLAALEAEVEAVASEMGIALESLLVFVRASSTGAAIEFADLLAPEHLQLAYEQEAARREAGSVDTAGCVLIGPTSATAFGDYAAGSNHVLPTGGAGRFSGPLGPRTFMRGITRLEVSEHAARELAPVVATLAEAEGFPVHGASATARASDAQEKPE